MICMRSHTRSDVHHARHVTYSFQLFRPSCSHRRNVRYRLRSLPEYSWSVTTFAIVLSDYLDRTFRLPNLSAARALALAASSSRFRGAVVVLSEWSRREETSAISSTAARKAASFAFDGLLKPVIFLANCNDAARTSSAVTGGSKLKSVLMFRHIPVITSQASLSVPILPSSYLLTVKLSRGSWAEFSATSVASGLRQVGDN